MSTMRCESVDLAYYIQVRVLRLMLWNFCGSLFQQRPRFEPNLHFYTRTRGKAQYFATNFIYRIFLRLSTKISCILFQERLQNSSVHVILEKRNKSSSWRVAYLVNWRNYGEFSFVFNFVGLKICYENHFWLKKGKNTYKSKFLSEKFHKKLKLREIWEVNSESLIFLEKFVKSETWEVMLIKVSRFTLQW